MLERLIVGDTEGADAAFVCGRDNGDPAVTGLKRDGLWPLGIAHEARYDIPDLASMATLNDWTAVAIVGDAPWRGRLARKLAYWLEHECGVKVAVDDRTDKPDSIAGVDSKHKETPAVDGEGDPA